MAYLFNLDWGRGVKVRRSYLSEVQNALSMAEQRRSLQGRPRHGLDLRFIASTQAEIQNYLMFLHRAAMASWLCPLFSDFGTLDAELASAGTVMSLDTTHRRFHTGMRVAVLDPDGSSFDVGVIDSITDTTITLSAGFTPAYPAGSLVFPLHEVRALLKSKQDVVTDLLTILTASTLETAGQQTMPALEDANTVPTGFTSHSGYPIMPPEWDDFGKPISYELIRAGSLSATGISQTATLYGDRPYYSFDVNVLCETRELAFDVIRFFDSRRGRTYPFWHISPLTDAAFLSFASTSQMTVTANGPVGDWELFRPYIAVVYNDGTLVIRQTDNALDNMDGTYEIALTSPIPSTSGISRVSLARLCRFDDDELVEEWDTNTHMSTTLKVVEIINEVTVADTNFTPASTTALTKKYSVTDL